MTKSLITYLFENWDPIKNPQAGFRFPFEGIICEIWVNTHPTTQTLIIQGYDGVMHQFQVNLFRESNHKNDFVNRVTDSLRNGFTELHPIHFSETFLKARTEESIVKC